jgi:hypothetical protein
MAAATANALVLGMAFISAEQATSAAANERSGTTNAGKRDRERLLLLMQAGYRIISMNHSHSAAECEPRQHLSAYFDRRAVAGVIELFGQGALDFIYGDYFRFPSAYLHGAYTPFLSSMLPELIRVGVMGPHTQLILPNPANSTLFDEIRDKEFVRRLLGNPSVTLPSCRLTCEPIPAHKNPLFVVTEQLQLIGHEALGGFTNAGQIEALHSTHPFVRICMKLEESPAAPDKTQPAGTSSHRQRAAMPRAASSKANTMLLAQPLHSNNYPPAATSTEVIDMDPPQYYWPIQQWEDGLHINSSLLRTRVAISNVLPDAKAGYGLFAEKRFEEGDTVGFLWGKFVAQEDWDAIKLQGKDPTHKGGEEDYVCPVQHGVHRVVSVPLQASGASLLLASQQCPIAYINQGRINNVAIEFPKHAFSDVDRPPYQYIRFVVRTQGKQGVPPGEEFTTDYGWSLPALRKLTTQYSIHLAKAPSKSEPMSQPQPRESAT